MNQNITKESNLTSSKVKKPLLNVENLNMSFKIRGLYFNALKNVSFSVNEGDFFGIIGESGSGKSTTGKCIIKLYQPTGGKIEIDNHLVSNKKLSRKTNKWLRKNVQMIFQDPMASLNPTKNILQLISEPLVINKTIYKEAFAKWTKLNNVAKYFLVDYIKKHDKEVNDFQITYLNKIKDIYTKALNDFEIGFNETDHYKITREKLIFKMDTLVENCQSLSPEITNFIKNSQEAVNDLMNKYDNQEFNEVFKEYEKNLKNLQKAKDIFDYSNEGVNLKQEILNLENELKEFKNNFKEKYIIQNYGYIKSFEITTKSNIKSLKQNMHFSKDTIDLTIHFINLTAQKVLLMFVKHLKENKYLEDFEINETIETTTKIVEQLFNPLSEKANKLSILFTNADITKKNIVIESLYAIRMFAETLYTNFKTNNWNNYEWIKNQYSAIYSKCPNFLDLDKEIKCSIFEYEKMEETIKENGALFNKLNGLLTLLVQKSNNKKELYDSELAERKTEIKNKKNDLKITVNFYKNNQPVFERNQNKYIDIKSIFEQSKLNRLRYLETEVLATLRSTDRQMYLNSKKAEIKLLKTDIKLLEKKISLKANNILKSIKYKIKHCNEQKTNKDKFLELFNVIPLTKYIKREVNLRKKSIESIKFEFKNSLFESTINSFIFEKNRLLNWIFIPALINLIKKDSVYKALDSVGLKREHAYRYPHEFSGGQRQRIVIARALINKPKIIIADEPISALDVSIQAQVINILQDLCKKQNVTILFIAHDLSMVNYACNNVIIMHRGRILEKGNVNKIFENPTHPYTRSLMKATPKLSRVHVDLAAFNENFTYDKDWSAFNKPEFVKINNDVDHEVYGTHEQVKNWIVQAKQDKDVE